MIEPHTSEVSSIEERIRIFIVEDHANLRELLGMYCRMQDDFELCGEAASGEEALEVLANLEGPPPHVGLIDYSLPGMSGTDLIGELRLRLPDMVHLVLSGHKGKEYSREALSAGARGYLLKGKPDEIAAAVRRAVAGERVFSPELEVT